MLPRRYQKEMQVLTETQVTQFLIAAENSRYKALYHLAITTGMRYSELIGLKWTDVDWEKRTIKIQRQLQYLPHKGYKFTEPKTRSGTRTIMIGETTLKILNEHHKKYAHKDQSGENLVFINGIGTQIYFKRFYKDFKRVLRNAELPEIRFHDLRHTAATLMISNGIPVLIVYKILGHSQHSVTMNVYAHASVEMQSEAAKLMENLVTPIPISLKEDQNQEFSK
jgi:integrase